MTEEEYHRIARREKIFYAVLIIAWNGVKVRSGKATAADEVGIDRAWRES